MLEKWNKNKFTVYDNEGNTVLELINELGSLTNDICDSLDNKTDLYGNHLGQWQGLNRPTLSDEGMRATVEKLDKEINKLSVIKLIDNIDGTDYKTGDYIDFNYVKSLQIQQFSDIMRKFRINKKIKILTRGTSMTYGFDTNSLDVREPLSTPTDRGTEHKRTRATQNYPEALKEYIDNVYGINSCELENIGYSGAWVKYSFDEYYKNRTGNLELIEFGTNDSRLNNCPYVGDVKKFIEYYEQLIVREILMGNGLILITPFQTRRTKDLDVETFRTAVFLLGKKFNIPVIDGGELVESYQYTIWSDETHLTGDGYKIIGYRIGASLLNKNLVNPQIVGENTVLLMSPTEDSCYYKGDSLFYTAPSGYTPDSIDQDRIACRLNKDGEIIYTFYAEQEGLVVLPSLYMYEGSKLEISLNNKIPQSKVRNVHTYYRYSDYDGSNPPSVILENTQGNKPYAKQNMYYWFGDENILKINNKGWHTLTFKNISDTPINLYGVEFLSVEDYCKAYELNHFTLFYDNNGIATGDIVLRESLENYKSVVIYYDFAGISSTECDFKPYAEHNIRLVNLSNSDSLSEYIGEMAIRKKDENTLTIVRNKGLVRDENGVAQPYTNSLITIKKIVGKL